MKTTAHPRIALAAVLALTLLPAGAAAAQSAGCVVVDGPGSAAGDVRCPGGGGVGGVGVVRPAPGGDVDDDATVLPGRIDRPEGAPAGEDDDTAGAPTLQSADADEELAATGVPAAATAAGALAALALGGGALAATRRRQRSES